jgi:hypothetical protein
MPVTSKAKAQFNWARVNNESFVIKYNIWLSIGDFDE